MIPLSEQLRPKTLSDIVGQNHLIGENEIYYDMIKNNHFISSILYGNPGTGKTSIAKVISKHFDYSFSFNASSDSKQALKDIVDMSKNNQVFVIIDEIHRMKKDTQDFLLPYIESGKVIIIGLTTETPYYAVNKAILSRCVIFKTNDLQSYDILIALKNAVYKLNLEFKITDETLKSIANYSNNDLRSAYNILEMLIIKFTNSDKEIITTNDLKTIPYFKNMNLDNKENNYYDILSALHKSIRGSDVNSSLHYLARLLILNDLKIICRRLMVIAYEDIGLSNPNMAVKTKIACDCALELGMPEARIILANTVIELALSPKSNTAYLAINEAIKDCEEIGDLPIPKHILNRYIDGKEFVYKYPHDYKNSIVKQNYAPEQIKHKKYYKPKTESSYEKALYERYLLIEKEIK